MKGLTLSILTASPLALGACTRGVCSFGGAGFDPISTEWQAHQDLIPPSATVCGHVKLPAGAEPDPSFSQTLRLDFADDPNPWVTIVDHLEKKGFVRSSQDTGNPEHQSALLARDKLNVNVTTHREGGRFWANLWLVP